MEYKLRPLGADWTDPVTVDRKVPLFKVTWTDTVNLLCREVGMLGGDGPVVVQADLQETDLRLDGTLRASAKAGEFPGAAVSFTCVDGDLRFATDMYGWNGQKMKAWQHNVRAIALALEHLRAVDRYGVSNKHQQYTGWRAIESNGSAGGSFAGSAARAVRWLMLKAEDHGWKVPLSEAGDLLGELAKLPQDAGDRAKLAEARKLMEAAGMLSPKTLADLAGVL